MKKNNIILIIAGVIALIFIGLYFNSRSEMAEMEEVFTEEKELLITEYQDLYTDFDSLRSNNTELEQQLQQERDRVAQLQDELRTVKASNARRIKELQTELTTMRGVMRSFVFQIDSLNQTNEKLKKDNEGMRKQIASARKAEAELKEQNEALTGKVQLAARLETRDVRGTGLTSKEKESNKISRITKLKVSFTILKNITSETGMRTVYLRIERPDGQLLMHSKNDTFKFEDQQLNFSAKRSIEYGGQETPAYIVYDVDSGELMNGEYGIELFTDGELIGNGKFSLN
ncbi:MAG: hypothetical protein MJZ31_05660 [Bacteroidales bacterium]|nr:hypothetical protein [Bacteroidales bacterium]